MEIFSAGGSAAVYGIITGPYNAGYGGYFSNTDTGNWDAWGVFGFSTGTGYFGGVGGECDNVNCTGVDGTSTNGIGVQGYSGSATGVLGGTGGGDFSMGVYGTNPGTQTVYGVYGSVTGAANTGYAGSFSNTSTSGWSLYAGTAPSYFAGKVGIGTASPATNLDVNGTIRFAYGGESCSASTVGGLYYSSTTHLMYGCLTAPTWTQIATAAGSPAAGSNTQVQFNSGGNLGGSSKLTWSGTTSP